VAKDLEQRAVPERHRRGRRHGTIQTFPSRTSAIEMTWDGADSAGCRGHKGAADQPGLGIEKLAPPFQCRSRVCRRRVGNRLMRHRSDCGVDGFTAIDSKTTACQPAESVRHGDDPKRAVTISCSAITRRSLRRCVDRQRCRWRLPHRCCRVLNQSPTYDASHFISRGLRKRRAGSASHSAGDLRGPSYADSTG